MQAAGESATGVVLIADAAVAVVLQLLQLVLAVVLVAAFPVDGAGAIGRRLELAVFQTSEGVVLALVQMHLAVVVLIPGVQLALGFLVQGVAGEVNVQRAAADTHKVAGAVVEPVDGRDVAQMALFAAATGIVLVAGLPAPVVTQVLGFEGELAELVVVPALGGVGGAE